MKAELIDSMGSDLSVVNSARVSFDKKSDWTEDGQLPERDKRLINYLARHNHWTPFSHATVTMRETVPIFVARQRFKHMVGFSYNEVSRRYVDDEPQFFMPDEWRLRPEGSVKQGSGDTHNMTTQISEMVSAINRKSLNLYQALIELDVAPEQARMVLPQSMYTSYYVTGSLAAWARAYKQRIDSDAQVEIRELASMWADIMEPLFPVSWEALT